jgi:hypothetical protein
MGRSEMSNTWGDHKGKANEPQYENDFVKDNIHKTSKINKIRDIQLYVRNYAKMESIKTISQFK